MRSKRFTLSCYHDDGIGWPPLRLPERNDSLNPPAPDRIPPSGERPRILGEAQWMPAGSGRIVTTNVSQGCCHDKKRRLVPHVRISVFAIAWHVRHRRCGG